MHERKKGFTLVELSIVLVIIGLLIGGILVAQSMISTSKVTATVAQIQQFDAGVENFKTKYNYLPGDAPAFGGDGDGILDISQIYNNAVDVHACELANFWFDMNPQEFASSACPGSGAQAITSGASKSVPLSKLGANGSFFIASAMGLAASGGLADTANPRNYYVILHPSELQTPGLGGYYRFTPTSSSNSAVKPSDLLALDTKMDDGIANTGNILSGAISAAAGNIVLDSPLSSCNDPTTHAYQIQNSTYECTPLIRIGAQAGDPQ